MFLQGDRDIQTTENKRRLINVIKLIIYLSQHSFFFRDSIDELNSTHFAIICCL